MTESRMKNDSSPLPSPQSRRRGDKDSGEYTIGVRCLTFCLLSLSQRERTKVRDCSARAIQRDSSPLPSPRTRRRGNTELIAYGIDTRRRVLFFLSLSQRERIKVRDYWWSVVRALAKWPQEHCQVLREPDDSKSEPRRSLVQPKISLGSDRISRASESHGLSRLIR